MAYQGYVVEIKELRPHNNADKLQIATVFGNDVITGLDVQLGWKMIYFPVDGQLSEEFASVNDLVRRKDENGKMAGGYLDPVKRNIKAIKLRGEKSDGLLVKLNTLSKVLGEDYVNKNIKVGDTIDVVNGKLICEKYIPKGNPSNGHTNNGNSKSKKQLMKETYPLFEEHKDTSQLAYSKNEFRVGDSVTVTLKLHGTSARTSHTTENKPTLLMRILKRLNINVAKKWATVSGSRRVILDSFDGGYYGDNKFRKQYHDLFSTKLKKGETVYYEIVGYAGKDKTIMGIADNKKMKDKKFIKQYGDKTVFHYGCENGESDIYVYRMTMTNEDGDVIEYPTWLAQLRCEQMGVKHVPVLETYKINNIDDTHQMFYEIEDMAEGVDLIGKTHIREGVVVRIENREKFTAFKQKSFDFKVLEGIIKDNAAEADMEEAQDLL